MPVQLTGVADDSSLGRQAVGDLMRDRREATRPELAREPKSASLKPAYSGPTYVPKQGKGIVTGDTYADPFEVTSLPFIEFGTTDGFIDDYDNTCPWDAPGSPDVVYRYNAPGAQVIRIDLCGSSYDTKVYIAESSDPFNYLACNDDWCGLDGWQSMIESFPMWAGMEIFIIVDGYGGDFGDYELQIQAYNGDDDTDPIRISSLPFVAELTTDGKTDDYDEACPDGSNSPDLVFIYTPISDQSITIDLCNSFYDTKVFVYEGVVAPGFPYDCNDDNPSCTFDGFNSLIECLPVTAFTDYYIVVDGWGGQSGVFALEVTDCSGGCWTGCDPGASFEPEECDYPGFDNVNGGCIWGGMVLPINPDEIICGTNRWDQSGPFDSDWYSRYLFEGDSVTWCVVASYPVEAGIMDVTDGCTGQPYAAFEWAAECETLYVGLRVSIDGHFAFVVAPDLSADYRPCDTDPEYHAVLSVDRDCGWAGCPFNAIWEGEPCTESPPDDYNGGCYSDPPSFLEIPDEVYVCGQTWRTVDDWDEDAFLRPMQAGETVRFAAQAEFPFVVYIYDLSAGCENLQVVDYAEGGPCDVIVLEGTAAAATDFIFVIFSQDVGIPYSCNSDSWEYTVVINPVTDCPDPVCATPDSYEEEECEITATQGFNAGCNSTPPTYRFISYDETVCGTSWYGTVGGSWWRDTDWHDAAIADGDSVVWCVTSEFLLDAWIIDVSPTCNFLENITIDYAQALPCDTVYLATRKLPGQNLKFVLAPQFNSQWLWCELGEWEWSAMLSQIGDCNCDCAHDPVCDSATDILDVAQAVNVAFRNFAPIPDANALCPWETTDVDCSGATDILDVTRFVNVAFRNGNPAEEFCLPCPSP